MHPSLQKTSSLASQPTAIGRQYSNQQAAATPLQGAIVGTSRGRQLPPQISNLPPNDPSWSLLIEEYFPRELHLNKDCHIQIKVAKKLLHCKLNFKQVEVEYQKSRDYVELVRKTPNLLEKVISLCWIPIFLSIDSVIFRQRKNYKCLILEKMAFFWFFRKNFCLQIVFIAASTVFGQALDVTCP